MENESEQVKHWYADTAIKSLNANFARFMAASEAANTPLTPEVQGTMQELVKDLTGAVVAILRRIDEKDNAD